MKFLPNFIKAKGKSGKTHSNGDEPSVEYVSQQLIQGSPTRTSGWICEGQDNSWQYECRLEEELE